jgi:hypothetical protein
VRFIPEKFLTAIALVVAAQAIGCNSKLPARSPVTEAPPAARAADIGFVLEVQGTWKVEGPGHIVLKAGDSVPAQGIVVQLDKPAGAGMVLVSLRTGEVKTIDAGHNDLGKIATSQNTKRAWSLASKRYHSELVSAQSRGGDDQRQLHEVLLSQKGSELDLAPAFEGLAPGLYRLRLEPIQGLVAGDVTDPIPLETYDWSPSSPAAMKVAIPLRGAYVLYAYRHQTSGPEASAVVVIASPDECKQMDNDFKAARELVTSWGNNAPEAVKVRFLQATLASLAAELLQNSLSKK